MATVTLVLEDYEKLQSYKEAYDKGFVYVSQGVYGWHHDVKCVSKEDAIKEIMEYNQELIKLCEKLKNLKWWQRIK